MVKTTFRIAIIQIVLNKMVWSFIYKTRSVYQRHPIKIVFLANNDHLPIDG